MITIDDILKRDLDGSVDIRQEDQEKINQIQFLFKKGDVEKITLLKYILKLCLKFIANNKFAEASILTDNIFTKELDVKYIIGDDKFLRENDILDDVKFVKFIENINNEFTYQKYNVDFTRISINYTIIIIKYVLQSYFGYLELHKAIQNKIMTLQIKNKQKAIIINIGNVKNFQILLPRC
jgi:hypothetical protein